MRLEDLTDEELEQWADVIEEQRKDDTTFQKPEYVPASDEHRAMSIIPMDRMDYIVDLYRTEYGDVRLPAERRPNTNGDPGGYDEVRTYMTTMRTGIFGPKPSGCKVHGFEFWRTPEMTGRTTPGRSYCVKCHKDRRLRRLGRETEITD